jgi:hypothetical protein
MEKTFIVVVIALVLMALAAIGGCTAGNMQQQATATQGMDAVSAGVQLIQQDMVLRLTQQAVENARIEAGAKMTATQQVVDAAATVDEKARKDKAAAVEAAREEKATAMAATATYEVWQITAQAGQTMQAIEYSNATSTVQAAETKQAIAYMAATDTSQAQATEKSVKATQDTTTWNLRATQQAAEAESAKLAAEREKMTNGVTAWGPWVGFAIALAAAVYFARQYLRVRAFKPDERGDAPYLVVDGVKVLDLDAMPGALLDLKTQTAPLLTSPENAAQIKARDQFIDLNTRGLPNQFQERKTNGQMPMLGSGVKIELAPYVEVQNLLGNAEQQLNDEEIK